MVYDQCDSRRNVDLGNDSAGKQASRDCVSGIRLRGQRETVLLGGKERMKEDQRRKQAETERRRSV